MGRERENCTRVSVSIVGFEWKFKRGSHSPCKWNLWRGYIGSLLQLNVSPSLVAGLPLLLSSLPFSNPEAFVRVSSTRAHKYSFLPVGNLIFPYFPIFSSSLSLSFSFWFIKLNETKTGSVVFEFAGREFFNQAVLNKLLKWYNGTPP